MKRIHLHGYLAEAFGPYFDLAVYSAGEAVRALEANFPGKFWAAIRDGSFRVQRGSGLNLAEDELSMRFSDAELHIVPVLGGAKGGKGKGFFGVILGVALIASAIAFAPAAAAGATGLSGMTGAALSSTAFTVAGLGVSYGQIAMFGLSLALQGVSGLLTPTPKVGDYGQRERPEERPSFLFNGATNTSEQGGPVPLVYGEHQPGSVVISAGLSVERLP